MAAPFTILGIDHVVLRAACHHVVAEIAKGVIDHRAHGFGGVALAPEWNTEPIADLG